MSQMSYRIDDHFWNRVINLARTEVIPYQWEALNDRVQGAAPSGCIRNFEIVAGRASGEHKGYVFQDSDLYKWLEAVAFSLQQHPDADLEKLADEVIDLICAAQQPDGYINTYFTLERPHARWRNMREAHELYCAGHMFEAAVAYYKVTGKRPVLDAAIRFADLIDATFGPEKGKMLSYPGHEEVELALVKLADVTGNNRYIELARYFVAQRGMDPYIYAEEENHPDFFFRSRVNLGREYYQAHKPPVDQEVAVGHAVRAMYLYTGMADLAIRGDKTLVVACDRLYNNVVSKQMHLTAAIGSNARGEAFTCDYDLPPDSVYAETCASIGLMMFTERMYKLHGKALYIDTMEQALYNTVLAGISLSGREFFYVNPLETHPKSRYQNPDLSHVRNTRQPWFDCACCPPNLARTMLSLGHYAYDADDASVTVKLYMSGEIKYANRLVKVKTGYPYEGKVCIEATGGKFALRLRSPGFAPICRATVNGEAVTLDFVDGWLVLDREWSGDNVELCLELEPRMMYAHPAVRHLRGKTAMTVGPLVYCAEGEDVGWHSLKPGTEFYRVDTPAGLPEGTVAFKSKSYKQVTKCDCLYRTSAPEYEESELVFIPYHLWGNKGEDEMTVFFLIKQ